MDMQFNIYDFQFIRLITIYISVCYVAVLIIDKLLKTVVIILILIINKN